MAVFRINKTQDYTVMSNFHLKDRSLSLKSKGLLSLILSLPEDWNYTTRGLAAICKEGVDSIGTALKVCCLKLNINYHSGFFVLSVQIGTVYAFRGFLMF